MARNYPITAPKSSSGGSPKSASAHGGRVKSFSGGGANFSATHNLKKGFPPPKAGGC